MLREDTQRLEERMATLEGMVESRDDLLMEIARETGQGRMGDDEDDEEKEEDADDRGDAAAPPAAAPDEIDEEGPMEVIPEEEASMPHEVSRQMPTMRRIHSDWRMTLMIWTSTRAKTTLTWMSSFPMMKVMIEIESLSLSLKIRNKNKFLGFT
jgi:hypothetical protein